MAMVYCAWTHVGLWHANEAHLEQPLIARFDELAIC